SPLAHENFAGGVGGFLGDFEVLLHVHGVGAASRAGLPVALVSKARRRRKGPSGGFSHASVHALDTQRQIA
ncbi:MAG: hypothetical protein KDJ70_22660, partial [Candidatus Competibacteraceae bacterium]|nr:hypothetical protein [Candidatus Competibacteraceae bacterium]